MDKKVFELKIDVEQGYDVNVISIVTEPATEEKFHYFSKEKAVEEAVEKQVFAVEEEEYELHGVAMIPVCLQTNLDKCLRSVLVL